MTYSRRNSVDEQQEACQKAKQIAAICGQFHITLDPIDWQQFGMWAPVKVNTIEIASLWISGNAIVMTFSAEFKSNFSNAQLSRLFMLDQISKP